VPSEGLVVDGLTSSVMIILLDFEDTRNRFLVKLFVSQNVIHGASPYLLSGTRETDDERGDEDYSYDSLWQKAMLAGALSIVPMQGELLSYQVPTYYGMICASFDRVLKGDDRGRGNV
jgi:hypothetical protein